MLPSPEPYVMPRHGDARHRRSVVLVYVVAALLCGGLLWVESLRVDRASMAAARERGAALFRLIEVSREWNARHGGVYVPITAETQPNPYLSHPHRDVLTTDGQALTLIDHACMTRQIAELAQQVEGLSLHITSLRPVRPANAPDPWEAEALRAFEQGVPEMLVLTRDEHGPVHRYMAPLRTTEACLQCHVEKDFKVGEVRGGISMTMPAEPLLVLRDAQRLRVVGLFLAAFALASGLFHYLLVLTRRHLRAIASINAEQERLIVQRTSELATSNAGLAREVEQRRHDQRLLATSEARYRAIFDSTAEGLMLIDEETRIQKVNPAFTTITGYEAEEVQGHGLEVLGAGRHDQAFFDTIRRTLAERGRWQGEVWNRRKSGDAYVQWMSITRASLPDEVGAYVATLTDITLRKEVEERMQYRADHDALTGMPNRGLFQDRLAAALAASHRTRQPFAVLFVDLDRFKAVNDRLGHPAGDALLIEAGARIAACARESDTVARFGGDEFAVILTEVGGFAEAEEVAQRICVALAAPFMLPQGEAQVASSVGIALSPTHGSDAATLEEHADQALYVAKRGGGNRWCVYSPTVAASAADRGEGRRRQ